MARILILDDDQDLLASQKMILESRGYETDTACTMEAAFDIISERKPDLILADLMMEHYDSGFVFCKKVKEMPGMSDIPILMQTSASRKMGFTFDASSSREKDWMKVDEVLTKAVPPDQLIGKINQHLARKGKNGST